MRPVGASGTQEGAHGVVEAHSQDLDAEVNGVAGQMALGPAPITVFEQEARVGEQLEVVGVAFAQGQSALLHQRHQWDQASGADLVAGPTRRGTRRGFRRGGGHSLSSSGVG